MEQKLTKRAPKPPKLRYNINSYLLAMTPLVRSKVKQRIMRKCNGISKSTLSRWCNLTTEDHADIPAMSLLHIADILNVEISDLINDKK